MISIKRLWKSNKYVVIDNSQLVVHIDSQDSQDTLFSIDYFYKRKNPLRENIKNFFNNKDIDQARLID